MLLAIRHPRDPYIRFDIFSHTNAFATRSAAPIELLNPDPTGDQSGPRVNPRACRLVHRRRLFVDDPGVHWSVWGRTSRVSTLPRTILHPFPARR